MSARQRELTALEINLQRTASEVEIPEEQRILLEATRDSVGVHEKTRLLLEEVNHPFVNWDHVLGELRSYAVGNFYFHNAFEKGDVAMRVLIDIFFSIGGKDGPPEVRLDACRTLLRYLEKVTDGAEKHLERNRPVVEDALKMLRDRFEEEPHLAAMLSGSLRRVLKTTLKHDTQWDRRLLCEIMKKALGETYRTWLMYPDPVAWIEPGMADSIPSLNRISRDSIRDYVVRLEKHSNEEYEDLARNSLDYPDQAVMENLYLRSADEIEKHFEGWKGYTSKVLFLLRILDTDKLLQVREPALRSINRALSRALRLEERPHAEGFIDAVFDSFSRETLQHDTTVLDCIHTIATDVLRSEDDELIEKVVDRILDYGFEKPEISGVTELWQFEANPAHIKNIRLWFELISMDPARMKRLLTALIFHLKIGGLFLSDTDLFQKDVANLLNADIRPVYNLVKQICKLFPIYFREIGAEGDVRKISTRVDEICRRQDSVIHFIRKQCHVESSSRLLPFIESVLCYWETGDHEPLRPHLPSEVFNRIPDETEHLLKVRPVVSMVVDRVDDYPRGLLNMPEGDVGELLSSIDGIEDHTREKVGLLIRLYQLIDQKYSIGPRGALEALDASSLVDEKSVAKLKAALMEDEYLHAVECLIAILEDLKTIIQHPKPAESREDIYHKRHIAVGIPSMYGRFINRKVEALGLSYRLESLTTILFERMVEGESLRYLTKRGIAWVAHWLALFRRALWVDGVASRGLGSRIDMMVSGLALGNLTIDQFINIFQFTSRTMREIIRHTIAMLNEPDIERILPQYLPDGGGGKPDWEKVRRTIEVFIRDQISSCFAVQTLDNLITRVLSTLTYEAETFGKTTRSLLMSYDIDKCFFPLQPEDEWRGDPILLGYKGSFLQRMAGFGYPVPAGFIVTTEVYRTFDALTAFRDLRAHTLEIMEQNLHEVERRTGKAFGDPKNPLLLSVRSGSAVSMPGILDTFLNVGINEEIAEGLSRQTRFGWAAWDCYRRFLQSWGLSYGVPQESFDQLFEEYKNRHSVSKKAFLTTEQMREVALICRDIIINHEVTIVEEPFLQLRFCIERVMQSWDSDQAKLYRKEMKIADDWGTAVVIQAMVYGNMDDRSGTGVLFTRNPKKKSGGISLYGDFVLRSQGEDVVRGLVETYPITEDQRLLAYHEEEISLETNFPEAYKELLRISEDLVNHRGFNHQEMEFTFENDDASSLYILQARDVVTPDDIEVITFEATPELEKSYITSGIGVSGGALSGMVAHSEKEILDLWETHPNCKIILIRPNTVPEDIHMIFLADGLLTSRGGATSHAAVAAQGIGRTCVVGCGSLHVEERAGRTVVGNNVIRTGEYISINGDNGAVYLGRHEVKQTRRVTEL